MSAEEANVMISKLEERLDAVEAKNESYSSQTRVDDSNLRIYQAKLLVRLKEIRSAIGTGDAGSIKKERDAALSENVELKKELERANYRIKHLVKELNKAEEQSSTLTKASVDKGATPQRKTMVEQMSASFHSVFG